MPESKYIHKSHNVSVILYHYVCPAKYRKVVFSPEVDNTIKDTCIEISKRYQVHFLEIGTDKNHVHFLVQSVPVYSPTKIRELCTTSRPFILWATYYPLKFIVIQRQHIDIIYIYLDIH